MRSHRMTLPCKPMQFHSARSALMLAGGPLPGEPAEEEEVESGKVQRIV